MNEKDRNVYTADKWRANTGWLDYYQRSWRGKGCSVRLPEINGFNIVPGWLVLFTPVTFNFFYNGSELSMKFSSGVGGNVMDRQKNRQTQRQTVSQPDRRYDSSENWSYFGFVILDVGSRLRFSLNGGSGGGHRPTKPQKRLSRRYYKLERRSQETVTHVQNAWWSVWQWSESLKVTRKRLSNLQVTTLQRSFTKLKKPSSIHTSFS